MNLKQKRQLLWTVVVAAFLLTWLPNLGILNSLDWIGPFSLPLFWVLLLNAILTVCVVVAYALCYKPFIQKVNEKPIEVEVMKK